MSLKCLGHVQVFKWTFYSYVCRPKCKIRSEKARKYSLNQKPSVMLRCVTSNHRRGILIHFLEKCFSSLLRFAGAFMDFNLKGPNIPVSRRRELWQDKRCAFTLLVFSHSGVDLCLGSQWLHLSQAAACGGYW